MGLWCGRMTAGGWTLMVAIWIAVLGVTVWAVCRLFPARRDDPRAALDTRLATGDVDLDTYRWIRARLDGDGSGAGTGAGSGAGTATGTGAGSGADTATGTGAGSGADTATGTGTGAPPERR